jgi:uncharacterized membrane protein
VLFLSLVCVTLYYLTYNSKTNKTKETRKREKKKEINRERWWTENKTNKQIHKKFPDSGIIAFQS